MSSTVICPNPKACRLLASHCCRVSCVASTSNCLVLTIADNSHISFLNDRFSSFNLVFFLFSSVNLTSISIFSSCRQTKSFYKKIKINRNKEKFTGNVIQSHTNVFHTTFKIMICSFVGRECKYDLVKDSSPVNCLISSSSASNFLSSSDLSPFFFFNISTCAQHVHVKYD